MGRTWKGEGTPAGAIGLVMGENQPVKMLSADLALDEALAAAVEFARSAVVDEVGAERVGEQLEVAMEGERLATHLFDCTSAGYRGWRWAVTLARTPDGQNPTVCDVVLLPGPESLVAPAWIPWSERVQPGDLGVGDVFPTSPEDPRLIAGFTDEDDLEGLGSRSPLAPSTWELGLGRARVLSQIGRDDAADRWYASETGPESAMAKSAPLPCASCGFVMPMGGAFGQMFAVCANVMSPADGRVVALDFGCGAHSEVQVDEVIVEGLAPDRMLAGDGPALELPEGGDLDAIEDVSTLGSDDDDEADEPRIDALALDDDLVEDAMEDLIGSVSSEDLEGLMLDDSAELEGSGEADEPSKDAEPEAGPAPKRSRGRGWLRGRLS
jgi:hypothetical protein